MPMPRFFFHVRSKATGRSRDHLGLVFLSVETACTEALRQAHSLKKLFEARGEDPRSHALEVENEAGEVVLYLSFADVFDGFDSTALNSEKTKGRRKA